jgi:hypothetical protein
MERVAEPAPEMRRLVLRRATVRILLLVLKEREENLDAEISQATRGYKEK